MVFEPAFLLFQIRIMMFMDNLYQCKDLLESESVVAFPLDAEKPYTPVAVRDVCRAVGAILRNPEPHQDKIYHLASDRFSLGDLTKAGTIHLYLDQFTYWEAGDLF